MNKKNKDDEKFYKYEFCRYCNTMLVVKVDAEIPVSICLPCRRIKSELMYNDRLRSKIQLMLEDIIRGDIK